ncbi:MAG: hypothetical protein H5U38_05970 [Calditrichaeota bacterium]|nr:hypothetical protein [Calditrichota bacterium]
MLQWRLLFFPTYSRDRLAMAVGWGTTGARAVPSAPPGRCWPWPFKDGDQRCDFDPNLPVGLLAVYEPAGNGVTDILVVGERATAAGVMMGLSAFAAPTERERHSAAPRTVSPYRFGSRGSLNARLPVLDLSGPVCLL